MVGVYVTANAYIDKKVLKKNFKCQVISLKIWMEGAVKS